ncbi:MAG: hypothetical protein HY901_30485 [Deltaproteobacteria bacterium]|nr:hypothetical protein [Deltaproteobacteria bacterium]
MLRNGAMALVATLTLLSCKGGGADMSKGGLELVYEAAPAGTDDGRAAALADSARKIVLARLAAAKIPAVVRLDGRKLRVGLPAGEGMSRAEDAKKVLGMVGAFEVREVQDAQFLKELGAGLDEEGPVKVSRDTWSDVNGAPRGCFMVDAADEANARKVFPKDKLPSGVDLLQQQGVPGERLVFIAVSAPVLNNESILSVKAIKDPMGTPVTNLKLTPDGAKKLEEATHRIKGKKLALVLDSVILSTPVVMTAMDQGELPLPQADVGDRKARERAADLLAAALGSGALPAALTLVEERHVAKSH